MRIEYALKYVHAERMSPSLSLLLQLGGPLFFLSMQAAYVDEVNYVLGAQSTAGKSAVPFLCLLANSFTWACYAFARGRLAAVLIPNLSGCVSALYCVCIFHMFAETTPVFGYAVTTAYMTAALSLAASRMLDVLGGAAMVSSVLLMGAPLVSLGTVVRTRSTASMSLGTSLATFLNAVAWVLYGYVEANDMLIVIPNLVGLGLASLQLLVLLLYSRQCASCSRKMTAAETHQGPIALTSTLTN